MEDEGSISPDINPSPPKRIPLQRTQSKFSGAVRVLLDIERLDSWYVRAQPGAVRRIVMNVLGNSLKYTGRSPNYIRSNHICTRHMLTEESRARVGLCLTAAYQREGS